MRSHRVLLLAVLAVLCLWTVGSGWHEHTDHRDHRDCPVCQAVQHAPAALLGPPVAAFAAPVLLSWFVPADANRDVDEPVRSLSSPRGPPFPSLFRA